MIIAMVAIGMMQMTVDQIVGVVAVGNGGVAAVGCVFVAGCVFISAMAGSADGGIRFADGDGMLVHM